MKNRRKNIIRALRFLLFVIIAISITSCNNLENIVIGDPEDVKVQGFEDNHLKLFVSVQVDNPSIYKFKLSNVDLRVYLNDRYIGKLIVDDEIQIQRKASLVYDLPVKIRLSNILSTAFIMMNLKQGEKIKVRFEGEVTGKTMFLKKSYAIDETKELVL